MIQVTIFLLWAILESIQLIKSNKWILGSILLALAINMKLLPLVVLPYLIYRREYKASFFVIIISVFLLYLPSIFIGSNYNSFLLAEWWHVINPMKSEHLIEFGTNSQSFVGMISVFLADNQGDIEIKRNFINLSIKESKLITNIVRLFFIVFTVYFMGSPFKKSVDKLLEIRAISYILLLVPLIFPHQQKYAFLFIFPMIIYLNYYCFVMWKLKRDCRTFIFLVSLIIISIIFTPLIGSDIIGRFTYDLIHHYRLLGISTVLLIIFAVIGKPETLKKVILENKVH